tara:strand:+ start:993 stop:1133 length:141 start_codon:yes stop_codon:yes gene_type:complete
MCLFSGSLVGVFIDESGLWISVGLAIGSGVETSLHKKQPKGFKDKS